MKRGFAIAGLLFCISALLFELAGDSETCLMFICIGMMFVSISSSVDNQENAQLKEVFEPGTFFVRLEKVDEELKIALIKTIRDITNLNLKQAKDKVDVVRLGSMSIIIENISEQKATSIKQIINSVGGTAVVVDNKSVF